MSVTEELLQANEAYASTFNQGDLSMPFADDVKARIEHVETGNLDEAT